jgi:DNA-directed RNA polymerase subunit M/transcription elongation factor TFIIS
MSDCEFSEEEIAAVDVGNLMTCVECGRLFIRKDFHVIRRNVCDICEAVREAEYKVLRRKKAIEYLKQQRELKNENR